MIQITYAQANALTSPVIKNLFNDTSRRFPFLDAIRLSNMLGDIDKSLVNYRKGFKNLIKDTNGIVLPNGLVKHENEDDRIEFEAAVNSINNEKIEINGFLLVLSDSWPNLTLAEAAILKPLIKEIDYAKEDGKEVKAAS